MSDNDRILNKYLKSAASGTEPKVTAEQEEIEDTGAFGYLRGSKERCTMLELRKKTGGIRAIGYSWLERAEFDPSDGIALHLLGHVIRIKGRNLNGTENSTTGLFSLLTRHRVPWLRESEWLETLEHMGNGTIIEEIKW